MDAPRVVSALDPSFRAQELSFVVAQVAANAEFTAAATRRSWLDRLLGRQPEGSLGPLAAVRRRAGAYATRRSLSLQNSLRGAAALAVAILIADASGVQHGFWVAFGTLSVLRSNALATGQNIVRALAGTTAGFVVGGALVYAIGTNTIAAVGAAPGCRAARRDGAGDDLVRRGAGVIHADAVDPVQPDCAGGLEDRPGADRGCRDRRCRQPRDRPAVLAAGGGERAGPGAGRGLQAERPLSGRRGRVRGRSL